MQWMDIKILDPEMETLMKELHAEQQRLKEALKEKLKLMRYDTEVLERENQETRDLLRSKGIQLEDDDIPLIKPECEIKIKEEAIEIEPEEFDNPEQLLDCSTSSKDAEISSPPILTSRPKRLRKPYQKQELNVSPEKECIPIQPRKRGRPRKNPLHNEVDGNLQKRQRTHRNMQKNP